MILWVNTFVSLKKYMGKSSDWLNCALSVSEHPSIKKLYISDKFIFCLNFKSMKHIKIAFIYWKIKSTNWAQNKKKKFLKGGEVLTPYVCPSLPTHCPTPETRALTSSAHRYFYLSLCCSLICPFFDIIYYLSAQDKFSILVSILPCLSHSSYFLIFMVL